MKQLVSVQYKSKTEPDTFGGRPYTYFCDLDVAVGDLVIAPVGSSESVAKVYEVDVPESKVDERIMPKLKTITKRYESEDAANE